MVCACQIVLLLLHFQISTMPLPYQPAIITQVLQALRPLQALVCQQVQELGFLVALPAEVAVEAEAPSSQKEPVNRIGGACDNMV